MIDGPRPNDVRHRLDAGGVVGTFLKLPSTEVVDLVAAAGYDMVVVDLEHSQLSEHEARLLIRHAYDVGLATVVRIPTVDRGLINRLLEAGSCGIQLSTTVRRQQVDDVIAATRYAPDGDRSISLAHVRAGFGAAGLAGFVASQRDDPPLVIAQVETASTEGPLETILAPPLDVAFIGTADLSVSLRTPGDLAAPVVTNRLSEIAHAAESAGVRLGGYAGDDAAVKQLVELGATYIMVGSDVGSLSGALRRTLHSARSVVGAETNGARSVR